MLTHAVMLGKPETGRPIPAEQISAVAMMSNLGWGSSKESPIRVAMGTSRTAAIVCEMLMASISWPYVVGVESLPTM